MAGLGLARLISAMFWQRLEGFSWSDLSSHYLIVLTRFLEHAIHFVTPRFSCGGARAYLRYMYGIAGQVSVHIRNPVCEWRPALPVARLVIL